MTLMFAVIAWKISFSRCYYFLFLNSCIFYKLSLLYYLNPYIYMQYLVVLALLQSLGLYTTLIEISLDGGFVSASVKTEDLMGDLRN